MQPVSRRTLLKDVPLALASSAATGGYYRVEKRAGHWWFITPENQPFFSIAMNQIDSATLRYAENIGIWRSRYNNSEKKWLEEGVGVHLREWGFNSVGWTQEGIIRTPSIHRHSRSWSYEQYQWLGLPYCHLLPFAEIHQWETQTRFPDFFSRDFEQWCDAVARDWCQRMAGDPKLIGYFYSDCPVWIHPGQATWRGPLFDPKKLDRQAGRDELHALATRYYKVTHDAIRRYDPNHLILGDRYEAMKPLSEIVLQAAVPYVDVMSFQYFDWPPQVSQGLAKFHKLTGKPVLLADSGVPAIHVTPQGTLEQQTPKDQMGAKYTEMIRALREVSGCVGWHVCGAYQANRTRGYGFLDENEKGDSEFLRAVRNANRETAEWVGKTSRAG